MKFDRVRLATWISDITDYIDIPWPLVHAQAGSDEIAWINEQDPVACQMIMDKEKDGTVRSLWAEFYNDGLRLEYALRFGK
jgi:hypothetical protein